MAREYDPYERICRTSPRLPFVASVVAGVTLQGCAGVRHVYPPEEARARAAALAPGQDIVVPYEATPEIEVLASRLTAGVPRTEEKLERIVAYFRASTILYDPHATATAAEVLATRRGNCLALSNLLVAMGRSAGLPLVYVDGSRHVDDHEVLEDVVLDYGHVAVAMQTEVAPADRRTVPDGRRPTHLRRHVIDFDGRLGPGDSFRVMTDLEAIAELYGNRGYELSRTAPEGLASDAVHDAFATAAALAPESGRAWSNLGAALHARRRTGEAAEAFRRAITLDPRLAAPRFNLARCLLADGRREEALELLAAAVRLSPGNGHYRAAERRAREARSGQ